MSILEKAKDWAVSNLVDEDVLAIVLVGSWARGEGTDVNDIDVIVIKQFQLMALFHTEHKAEDFLLDIWTHDIDAIRGDLSGNIQDLNQINNTSMILSFLSKFEVWFEKNSVMSELVEIANNWQWKPELEKFLEFSYDKPSTQYLVNALEENINLLESAKERLKQGHPVSHRRKDYGELITEETAEKAKTLLEQTDVVYQKLGIDRNWTEFDDARKAISMQKWGDAVASLKDVLRFIIRYELPSVPEQLLDPSIWKSIEDMKISDELTLALRTAYE